MADRAALGAIAPAEEAPKVERVRHGAVMRFVLNRPRALNAFDDEMRGVIADEIPKLARNPDIYIAALTSASPKAFCAGGDVRALTRDAKTDLADVKGRFAREYQMNGLLECCSKPSVSFIDGLCMGSGAGLTCYNTHRIAGANYSWAMPETAIGLFPDVGVAHVLARMPWPIGLYLGLTGRRLGRADAFALGLVTHCIDADAYEGIIGKLGEAEPVDPLLDRLHRDPGAGPLERDRAMIEDLFAGPDLRAIVARLEKASGGLQFARTTLADLRKASPISLAITDRHIRNCRNLDLRQTLIEDYRLAVRCLEANDFYEGVRAALVDKDGAPVWQPSTLEKVNDALVDRYFSVLPEGDLTLPTRAEMQAARV